MRVTIQRVSIPAMSTVGFLEGVDDDGKVVSIALGHREARHIGADLQAGECITLELEGWEILAIEDPADVVEEEAK